ncbi:MAG: penicillin-binding protein activator LpoB [Ignavibacteria bacterium]|nr:penicillin-binding protein activator LpoB [Ignavibacteria bacterium]
MKYRIYLLFSLLTFALFCAGCGSSVYVSNDDTTQKDDKYSDTDLKIMASKMYESIIERLNVLRNGQTKPPVIAFLNITNKTSEFINTSEIADKLQIQLIKAGALRFVDRQRLKDLTAQFDLSASGLMNPETAKKAGKVLGNDYFLVGDLSSINKSDRSSSLTFYRLSLRLVDAETSEIVWADESEIKKEKSKNFLDW